MNKHPILSLSARSYRHLIRPVLFHFDSERVHETLTTVGEFASSSSLIRAGMSRVWKADNKLLHTSVAGIDFKSPIGLSAGFDYDAKLPGLLPSLGFGFGTIGTVTNQAYPGNPSPRLGRLPKSQSLLVNKGFKSCGAAEMVKKVANKHWQVPIGISIGKTNNPSISTVRDAIKDIIATFRQFESAPVHHSYYELNISCPNLMGSVSFYPAHHLDHLLDVVCSLQLKKPLFIKMPISVENEQFVSMLNVIVQYPVAGIIVGNLQKDRQTPSLDQTEVEQYPTGNFSGKATFDRSNELIELTYKMYGNSLAIIGSGGVFTARDAYEKIIRGASLIQMITALNFEGPQVVSQINLGLVELLEKQGFTSIRDAVGSKLS
jgi:dihydroorotate dehydrogenase